MAASSYDPTTGAPVFLDADAPDPAVNPTQVAAYAASVGTRLIGSTAERTAYTYAREGLKWYDTTTGFEYIHDGTGWVESWADTGWSNIVTFGTGWTATTNYTPRIKRVGTTVYLEGAVTRTLTSGALADVLTIPAGYRAVSSRSHFLDAVVTSGGQAAQLFFLLSDTSKLQIASGYLTATLGSGVVMPVKTSWSIE